MHRFCFISLLLFFLKFEKHMSWPILLNQHDDFPHFNVDVPETNRKNSEHLLAREGSFSESPSLAPTSTVDPFPVVLVAGTGEGAYGGDGILANSTTVNGATGLAVDISGNLYIADLNNYRVRMVSRSNGKISTFAGTGESTPFVENKPAVDSQIDGPYGLAFDTAGNLYVSEYFGNRIVKIAADASNTLSRVCGAVDSQLTGTSANNQPCLSISISPVKAMVVDSSANLYFTEEGIYHVTKVSLATNIVSTFAGTGTLALSPAPSTPSPATSVGLYDIQSLWINSVSELFIAGQQNIYKVNIGTGLLSRYVGTDVAANPVDGQPGTSTSIQLISQLTGDAYGNLYIGSDDESEWDHKVYVVSAITTELSTLIENGVDNGLEDLTNGFYVPRITGMAVATDGTFYFSTYSKIYKVEYGDSNAEFSPSIEPTMEPTMEPSEEPSEAPSEAPSLEPSAVPSFTQTAPPSVSPTLTEFVGPRDDWSSVAMSSTGQYITAVTGEGSVYVSSTYGVSWKVATGTESTWQSVQMSSSGQYQVAASMSSFCMISGDYGVSWAVVNGCMGSVTAGRKPQQAAMDSTGQYMGMAAISLKRSRSRSRRLDSSQGFFYRSSNYGQTWLATTISGAGEANGYVISTNGSFQVACDSVTGTIYRSFDYGTSFSSSVVAPGGWMNLVMSDSGQYIGVYSYTAGLLYISRDFGVTWSSTTYVFTAYSVSGTGQYWIGTASGFVYRSSDFGVSWTLSTASYESIAATVISSVGNYSVVAISNSNILLASGFDSFDFAGLFPTSLPTSQPSSQPTSNPSIPVKLISTVTPSLVPTLSPSLVPTPTPSKAPSYMPSVDPSQSPTFSPSHTPSCSPSHTPSTIPSLAPSCNPSHIPSHTPSHTPSFIPSVTPTVITSIPSPAVPTTRAPSAAITNSFILPSFNSRSISASVLSSSQILLTVPFESASRYAGSVYCIALQVGKRPASTSVVLQSTSVTSYGIGTSSVSVSLSFLTPLQTYSTYCAALGIDNQQTSYSNVLSTALNVTTSCCKSLLFTSVPSLIYNSASVYTSGLLSPVTITYQLDVLPKDNVVVRLVLYTTGASGDVNELDRTLYTVSPATRVFTRSSTLLSSSFVVTILSTSITGTYNLSLIATGGVSQHEYSNSTAAQAIQVLAYNEASIPAPQFIQARFGDAGTTVYLTFDSATNRAGYAVNARFACGNLFVFTGATTASCAWLNATTLLASLVAPRSLIVGDTVSVIANKVRASCVNLNALLCNNFANNTMTSVSLLAPFNPIVPVPILTLPSSVNPCASFVIHPRLSTGSGGRSWRFVLWNVSTNTLSAESSAAILQGLLQTSTGYSSTRSSTSVAAGSLSAGTYFVTLTLTNFLGKQSSRTASFIYDGQGINTPSVNILGSSEVTITPHTSLQLQSNATVSSCLDSSTLSSSLTFAWTVYDADGAVLPDLISASKNPRFFALASYQLTAGKIYTVTVTVSVPASVLYAASSASASATISVVDGDVVAVIDGGSVQRISEDRTLDGSSSYDENESLSSSSSLLFFQWTCEIASLANFGDDCAYIFASTSLLNTSQVTVAYDSLSTDVDYNVYLTVLSTADTTRSATSTVSMSRLALSDSSSTATATIGLVSSTINSDSFLVLTGFIQSFTGDVEATWSATQGDEEVALTTGIVSVTQTSINITSTLAQIGVSFQLKVYAGFLTVGAATTFALSVYQRLQTNQRTLLTFTAVDITVNGPPSGGSLFISPSTGYAFNTTFYFETSDWDDDSSSNLPLAYDFRYYVPPTVNYLFVQAKSYGESASSQLPAGQDAYANVVYITVRAFDVYSANASVTSFVNVTLPASTLEETTRFVTSTLYDALNASNYDAALIAVNSVVSYLAVVACDQVPPAYCASLNRSACGADTGGSPQTCGYCKDGYNGVIGYSNTPCSLDTSGLAKIGESCRSDDDCLQKLCGNYDDQLVGICQIPFQSCPSSVLNTVCSGHGSCRYTSSVTLTELDFASCTIYNVYCVPTCICEAGYSGEDCAYAEEDVALRLSALELACSTIVTVHNYSDAVSALLDSLASTLLLTSTGLKGLNDTESGTTGTFSSGCVKALEVVTELTAKGLLSGTAYDAIDNVVAILSNYVEAGQTAYLGDQLSLITQGILAALANGEDPRKISQSNLQIVVRRDLLSDFSNATLAFPQTAEELAYGNASGMVSQPAIQFVGNSGQYCGNTAGYVRFAAAKWSINPYVILSSTLSSILRTEVYANPSSAPPSYDGNQSDVAYYYTVPFASVQQFTEYSLEEKLANPTLNDTIPSCTSYNISTASYDACGGCVISSYTNYSVTYACYDISKVCGSSSDDSSSDSARRTLYPWEVSAYDKSNSARHLLSLSGDDDGSQLSTPNANIHQVAALLKASGDVVFVLLQQNPFNLDLQESKGIVAFIATLFFVFVVGAVGFARWDRMDYYVLTYGAADESSRRVKEKLPEVLLLSKKKQKSIRNRVEYASLSDDIAKETQAKNGDTYMTRLYDVLARKRYEGFAYAAHIFGTNTMLASEDDGEVEQEDRLQCDASVNDSQSPGTLASPSPSQQPHRRSTHKPQDGHHLRLSSIKTMLEDAIPITARLWKLRGFRGMLRLMVENHALTTMFYVPSMSDSRLLRWLGLFMNLGLLLFLDTLFFGIFYADKGTCESYVTKETCLRDVNAATGSALCVWDGYTSYTLTDTASTYTTTGQCSLKSPPGTITFTLLVATLSLIFGLPLELVFDYLRRNVLAKVPDDWFLADEKDKDGKSNNSVTRQQQSTSLHSHQQVRQQWRKYLQRIEQPEGNPHTPELKDLPIDTSLAKHDDLSSPGERKGEKTGDNVSERVQRFRINQTQQKWPYQQQSPHPPALASIDHHHHHTGDTAMADHGDLKSKTNHTVYNEEDDDYTHAMMTYLDTSVAEADTDAEALYVLQELQAFSEAYAQFQLQHAVFNSRVLTHEGQREDANSYSQQSYLLSLELKALERILGLHIDGTCARTSMLEVIKESIHRWTPCISSSSAADDKNSSHHSRYTVRRLKYLLRQAKRDALNIRQRVDVVSVNAARSQDKDIALIRYFVLEQFSAFKRYVLHARLFPLTTTLPQRISAPLWITGWIVYVACLLFFLYWIFNWGVSSGNKTFRSWGLNFVLVFIQELLVTQIVKIVVLQLIALYAIEPQLLAIYRTLYRRALEIVVIDTKSHHRQKEPGISPSFKSHATMSAEPHSSSVLASALNQSPLSPLSDDVHSIHRSTVSSSRHAKREDPQSRHHLLKQQQVPPSTQSCHLIQHLSASCRAAHQLGSSSISSLVSARLLRRITGADLELCQGMGHKPLHLLVLYFVAIPVVLGFLGQEVAEVVLSSMLPTSMYMFILVNYYIWQASVLGIVMLYVGMVVVLWWRYGVMKQLSIVSVRRPPQHTRTKTMTMAEDKDTLYVAPTASLKNTTTTNQVEATSDVATTVEVLNWSQRLYRTCTRLLWTLQAFYEQLLLRPARALYSTLLRGFTYVFYNDEAMLDKQYHVARRWRTMNLPVYLQVYDYSVNVSEGICDSFHDGESKIEVGEELTSSGASSVSSSTKNTFIMPVEISSLHRSHWHAQVKQLSSRKLHSSAYRHSDDQKRSSHSYQTHQQLQTASNDPSTLNERSKGSLLSRLSRAFGGTHGLHDIIPNNGSAPHGHEQGAEVRNVYEDPLLLSKEVPMDHGDVKRDDETHFLSTYPDHVLTRG